MMQPTEVHVILLCTWIIHQLLNGTCCFLFLVFSFSFPVLFPVYFFSSSFFFSVSCLLFPASSLCLCGTLVHLNHPSDLKWSMLCWIAKQVYTTSSPMQSVQKYFANISQILHNIFLPRHLKLCVVFFKQQTHQLWLEYWPRKTTKSSQSALLVIHMFLQIYGKFGARTHLTTKSGIWFHQIKPWKV